MTARIFFALPAAARWWLYPRLARRLDKAARSHPSAAPRMIRMRAQ